MGVDMSDSQDKDKLLAAKDRAIASMESTIHQMWLRAGKLETQIKEQAARIKELETARENV